MSCELGALCVSISLNLRIRQVQFRMRSDKQHCLIHMKVSQHCRSTHVHVSESASVKIQAKGQFHDANV